MFEHELLVSQFQLNYAHALLGGIEDEQFAFQPLPGVHHPAWIIGHLAVVMDRLPRLISHERALSEEWQELFAPGTAPLADRALYPAKQELIGALDRAHERAAVLVRETPAEVFARPNPIKSPQMSVFPTVGGMVALLLTGHEATHLGQLSFWRRCVGLPALF